MEARTSHPASAQRQQQQNGDQTCSREPPPYPGHLKHWQQSGYSTSYSGSEASTDNMSMSSLESLSTSARQEPQGEETADLVSGLLDGGHASQSLSSLCDDDEDDDVDLKSAPPGDMEAYYEVTPSVDTWPGIITKQVSTQQTVVSSVPSSGYSSPKFAQSSTGSDCRQFPAYAANSLIRQLLQTSPQYSHLLSDITAMRGSSGSVGQTNSAASGSPKPGSPRELRSVGRSLSTVPTDAVEQQQQQQQQLKPSSPPTPQHQQQQQQQCSGSPARYPAHNHITSQRLVNGYVNVDNEHSFAVNPEAGSQPRITSRDRPRPSTAPAERETQPIYSVPAFLEQTERRRSFEILDRDVAPPTTTGILVLHNQQTMRQQQQQQVPFRRTSPSQGQQTTVVQYQQRGSPPQARSSPPQQQRQLQLQPQQRCSPQQEHAAAVTSSCLLPARSVNSPSHSPSSSQQNSCAHAAIATRATQMVERLSEENRALRQELKVYYKKVSKLEKVERDIQKVNDAYETLARHSQKRENLEKLMRLKLEAEISRLTDSNQQIQDNLEQSLLQLQRRQVYNSPDSDLKKEILRKDALITKFIAQNRELTAAKLRLESDINKQCSVVQETRARIKMLENVLAKEVLEKRCLNRQNSASSDNQGSGDICDGQSEDFQPYKYQQCDTDDGISSDSESPMSVHSLLRQMQEKERHILRLEADVAMWEQKFVEETVFRQLEVDAISIPKDAKIAALVQNSADTDKLLTEARLEKLAYLKQLHSAHERCANLEARVKNLQADLAERDSLVRVLQHHSSLSRASSISSLLAASCGSPPYSPQQHRSTTGTALHTNNSKPASGTSSRQGSQLSAGSLSLTKPINKLVGNYNTGAQMSALDQKMSYNGIATSHADSDQLKQCYWQV